MEKYKCSEKNEKIKRAVLSMAAGAAIGAVNGFFGGGGGMLLVPALGKLLKLGEKQSHATAIAVMLPLSAVSAAVYMVKGVSGGESLLLSGGGVIIGGIVGACLLKKLSSRFIRSLFYVVMIVAGVRMIIA